MKIIKATRWLPLQLIYCVRANVDVEAAADLSSPSEVLRGITSTTSWNENIFFLFCFVLFASFVDIKTVNQPKATHKQSDQTTNISFRPSTAWEKKSPCALFFGSCRNEGEKEVLMAVYEM